MILRDEALAGALAVHPMVRASTAPSRCHGVEQHSAAVPPGDTATSVQNGPSPLDSGLSLVMIGRFADIQSTNKHLDHARRTSSPRAAHDMFTTTTTTSIASARTARTISSSSRTRTRRAAATVVVRASSEADRELREGELSVKKGLLATFIKEGEAEVTAEKYQAYQAEIAARKAEAQKRAAEARANRKGPFGLW